MTEPTLTHRSTNQTRFARWRRFVNAMPATLAVAFCIVAVLAGLLVLLTKGCTS